MSKLTDKFLGENEIDRAYKDKNSKIIYITEYAHATIKIDEHQEDERVHIFNVDANTGALDKFITLKKFKDNFIDITDEFYSHLIDE